MANYANLKATIAANIKQNGNEEITGPILQSVLTQMTTLLGSGWAYAGVATPATAPGTPDNNVFYITSTAGTYTNFGGLVVAENEVAILKYNGAWAKDVPGIATAAQVTQLGQEISEIANNLQLAATAPNTTAAYYHLDNALALGKSYKLIVTSDTSATGVYIAVSTVDASSGRGAWFASDANIFVGKNEFEFVCDKENAAYINIYSSTLQSANVTIKIYEYLANKRIGDNLVVGTSIADHSVTSKKLASNITGPVTFNGNNFVKSSDIYKLNPIIPAGKNLLNPNEYENGYIDSSGDFVDDSGWKTTWYIDVSKLTNLFFSANNNGYRTDIQMYFFSAYDADKNFISELYTNSQGVPYSVPANVKYIRFSYHNYTDFQLEEGIAKTAYVAFVGKYETSSRKWLNKKWVCIGDSLTERNNRTTISYHDYVSRMTGIQIVNLGVSGTGYMQTNNPFYNRISNIPSDVDVITIFGSGNDTGNPLGEITDSGLDTICGCINHTLDLIQANFPLVPLGVVTPTPWINKEPSDVGNAMIPYCEAIVEICKRRSIPCLDLYHCSNLHPDDADFRAVAYSKDFRPDGVTLNGVHPDENGHKLIAPRFYSFLDSLIYNSSY